MKRPYEVNRLLLLVAMGIATLMVIGFDGRSVVQATDHEMNIVITITDQGFKVKGHTTQIGRAHV